MQKTLENVDFKALGECKEDFVREMIIAPILKALGFIPKGEVASKESPNLLEMELSKTLKTPTILGSNEKIDMRNIIPDYTLYVDSKAHCILDAKAPKENIISGKNPLQAFYYAIHKDIRAPFYALCNGYKFTLFGTVGQELLLEISLEELDFKDSKVQDSKDFRLLRQYLTTPLESLRQSLATHTKEPKLNDSWYLSREIPKSIKNPKKQAKARYFGCTAYFTRQSWDIVALNIKNFTQEGDVVLDPFGGSGVSAIEACMEGRYGIHTDLNPLSIFMTKALCAKVNLGDLWDISEEILSEFEGLKPKNEKQAKALLKNAKYYKNAMDKEFGEVASAKEQEILWIPKDEILPKGSDVDCVLGLFSPMQLAELALLRKIIFKKTMPSGTRENRERKRNMRYSLMLAFYNTITMCNLTFHETKSRKGKAGVCGIFAYYRYRIAKTTERFDTADIFRGKVNRIIKGKTELEISPYFYPIYFHPLPDIIKDFSGSMLAQRGDIGNVDSRESINGERFFQADATNLGEIESKSIDYIYTDPPYGAKIPYLDLSVMWNVWLDLEVEQDVREKECIEKGSLEKSRKQYQSLMKQSLKEMYRVLKPNRWLSFVFQHQDPQLWQVLVEAAEEIGFEYVGSISQNNGQESFKKVQKPFRVLSGQLIVHFKKVDNPKARVKEELGYNFGTIVDCAKEVIMRNNGATLNEIHDAIMMRAMDGGFLKELSEKFDDLFPFVEQRMVFDPETNLYHIKEFDPHKDYLIPIKVKAKYFIISYLNKCKREGKKALFDEICLEIIPLLKNGITPDTATIHDILEQVAFVGDNGEWHLKTSERTLF